MIRTGFKTDFAAKSSEKFVGKAAGGKGSSGVLRARREPFSPTTQIHAPSQPVAAESSFETSSKNAFS
jgi:hypothetical protein